MDIYNIPSLYPYPAGEPLTLFYGDREILTGTEQEIWAWVHRHLGCSVYHALKYEGYSISLAEVSE